MPEHIPTEGRKYYTALGWCPEDGEELAFITYAADTDPAPEEEAECPECGQVWRWDELEQLHLATSWLWPLVTIYPHQV